MIGEVEKSRAHALIILVRNDMWWTHCFSGAEKLKAIYGCEIPSLKGVTLHEIQFLRDWPTANLRLDLAGFPSSPPQKWVKEGFNRVQLELVAFSIREIRVDGDFHESELDLKVAYESDLVKLESTDRCLNLLIKSEFLRVGKISAYHSE